MSWLRTAVSKAVEAGNKNNITDSVVHQAGQAVAEGAKLIHDRISENEDLKTAQLKKLHLLIDKARVEKHHEVLGIGCGWGSLAIETVKRTGCRYTGITLAEEQLKLAEKKVKEAGLQVHITQGDYDGQAIIISWVTPDEPGHRNVWYGKSQNDYTVSSEGSMTNYTFYKYNSGYIHHCLLDGLDGLEVCPTCFLQD